MSLEALFSEGSFPWGQQNTEKKLIGSKIILRDQEEELVVTAWEKQLRIDDTKCS